VSLEGRLTLDLRPNHRITIALESVRTAHGQLDFRTKFAETRDTTPSTMSSLSMQSEWQPRPSISVTTGVSYDYLSAHMSSYASSVLGEEASNLPRTRESHFTPRLAVLFRRNPGSTLKLLYGQGFRTPNAWERVNTYDDNLHEESVRTFEVVGEHRISSNVMLTTSVYDTAINDVLRWNVEEIVENGGKIASRGLELQVDHRREDGLWTYVSYSLARAVEDDERMANSPLHLLKAGVSTSTSRRIQGALDVRWESDRRTLAGQSAGPGWLTDLHMAASLTSHVTAAVTIRNVFDVKYGYPGGTEHRQDILPQDGRTFLFTLTVRSR
jgi:outer membrane receptor protein involved in Fe transport